MTGYHLVRPIGNNAADDSKLTSGRVFETLCAGGDDPNDVYSRIAAQFDPLKTSYLIWNADAKHASLPLVAEVRKVDAPENGGPPNSVELVTIDQGAASFPLEDGANADAEFQPPLKRLPRRRLSDLLPGELVLAYGHLAPDIKLKPPPAPGRFVIDTLGENAFLKLSSGVRGTFEPLLLEPGETLREGSQLGRAIVHTQ